MPSEQTIAATQVEVTAHSRLHFGLFSFGPREGRSQFGGVGAMIDRPRLQLRLALADDWSASGPNSDRALAFAQEAVAGLQLADDLRCRITVLEAPAAHVGLGSGTQLALAVANGLCRLVRRPITRLEELATVMGRARRSSVGMHGFFRGGMIVDAGKRPQDVVSPLLARIDLPAPWRFVLLFSPNEQGLFGDAEEQAFAELPPVDAPTATGLRHLALEELMASAANMRYAEFGEALYRYGRQAGLCYAAQQGGPYASPRLERLVEAVRELGAPGVTQSSWGPTLCVAMSSQTAAEEFVRRFEALPEAHGMSTLITAAANQGARVSVLSDSSM
ncbi:MAG: beta-RFAP synthase [Planctomycetia bacterium]|nr:beta-RFAP synthase [Planctomycetia bacterium]